MSNFIHTPVVNYKLLATVAVKFATNTLPTVSKIKQFYGTGQNKITGLTGLGYDMDMLAFSSHRVAPCKHTTETNAS